jgi:predicted DNA-binding protein (MmcQ/YjbR family)
MPTFKTLQALALALPQVTEEPHFEKTSFRVKKKIFATYDAATKTAVLKFTEQEQDIFSIAGKGTVSAVNNKWGKQGWTNVDIAKVSKELLQDMLTTAYCDVAPAKLAALVKPANDTDI